MRRRLLFALSILFLVGLGTTLVYLKKISETAWADLADRSLQVQAKALADAYQPGSREPLAELSAEWRDVYDREDGDFSFTIYDRFLRPSMSSASLKGRRLKLQALPRNDQRVGEVVLVEPGDVPTVAIRLPGGGIAMVARAKIKSEALVESLHQEDMETVLVFMLFGILTMIVITVVAFASLRPIVAVSRAAATIGPNTLHKRIETRGVPFEVLPLVDAFNGALDRLAQAQIMQRRLTADAAHELRTPLAVLSLRLQRARMGENIDWPAIITDLARLSRLVEQLLDLARKEAKAGLADEMEDVKLSRTVREAAAMILPLAEESGRIVEVEIPAKLTLSNGHAGDLLDMVRNLIENAVIHGAGTVHIHLDYAGNGMARLAISDQGPTPPDTASLFLRFRRGNEERPGSGLGLAIVQQVATAHGGSVAFADSPTTRLEVLLPAIIDTGGPLRRHQRREPGGFTLEDSL